MSMPEFIAIPSSHNKTSPSPGEIQNLSSCNLSKHASLIMPPFLSVNTIYLQSPIAHFSRFLGFIYLINLYASGPETSTCLSAAKSPNVTSFTKLSYSFSGPAKLVGKYILL